MYSAEVQRQARTTATYHERRHPSLAGTTAGRPPAPLVRDDEDHARHAPDGPDAREAPRPLTDNTAGTAAWLDAREPGLRGDLTRRRASASRSHTYCRVPATAEYWSTLTLCRPGGGQGHPARRHGPERADGPLQHRRPGPADLRDQARRRGLLRREFTLQTQRPRGTSRGTAGREIPVQSVLQVRSIVLSVQVKPRE